MITFDLYNPSGTPSQAFFSGPIQGGAIVQLDSKGFYPGYFKDRQTKEMVLFAVLPDQGLISQDSDAIENLSFVEAEIGEHNDESAKVIIRSIFSMGEWARRAWLPSKAGLDLAEEGSRPPEDMLASLREELRSKEAVVRILENGASDALKAVWLVKCDTDRRAVVFCASPKPSYLARL